MLRRAGRRLSAGRRPQTTIDAANRPAEDLDGWPVISEPIAAARPAGHSLAERDGVTLAELNA